jgi:hypothetical protein
MWSLSDAKLFCRRHARYAEGYFQRHLLAAHCANTKTGLPAHIRDLYTTRSIASLRPRRLATIPVDCIAIARMWRQRVRLPPIERANHGVASQREPTHNSTHTSRQGGTSSVGAHHSGRASSTRVPQQPSGM